MDPNILAAGLAFLSTIIALYLKDFMDKKWAAKQAERQQLDTAKVYADPLLLDTELLMKRLKEIFEDKARFLSRRAPNNEYYQYMLRSTLYRFCAVLGWLRAANRELSGIEVQNEKDYKDIKSAIGQFEQALYKGNGLGENRIHFLAEVWKIEPKTKLDTTDLEQLSGEIQEAIWNEISTYHDCLLEKKKNKKQLDPNEARVHFAYELPVESQEALLEKIAYKIMDAYHVEVEDVRELVSRKRRVCIKAISRMESWIYPDWQAAIGDMMLKESRHTNRRFEVIGFSQFEDAYLKNEEEGQEDNRWLERVARLFLHLNLSRDEVFDARVHQLQNIFHAGLKLVEVLDRVDFGAIKVDDDWEEIASFDPAAYLKPKRTKKVEAEVENQPTEMDTA